MAGLNISEPVKWSKLLASGNVIPGDTIYLRGGTYSGNFVASFAGTEAAPITVKPYPGEVVTIDGSLWIEGAYTIWQDLIGLYSGWTSRTTETPGSPEDIPYLKTWDIKAAHTKIINCTLHDLAGFLANYPAEGSEIYGNLMYNFGWSGPDRGHAHGLYAQNIGAKVSVENNISFQNFSTGLKFFGDEAYCNNYDVIGNTAFNNGILYDRGIGSGGGHGCWNLLAGSWTPTSTGFSWLNNMTYHSDDKIGANDTNNLCSGDGITGGGLDSPVITGNYLAGRGPDFSGTNIGPCLTPTITGNTFIGTLAGSALRFDELDDNTYHAWPGDTNVVFVMPNDYSSTRANVTIYNWTGANTVSVDLTSVTGLAVGDQVTFANVQDLFVDIQTLTLDADKKVVVNMQVANRTVAAPTLWTAPVSTFPTFGCFLVKKV